MFDGAIVTPDFMVYDINRSKVLPEYLELVLQNEAILNQFATSSSGTTGRRRLSQRVFEDTRIALPSLEEQHNLVAEIIQIRKSQKVLENRMKANVDSFNRKIFNKHETTFFKDNF
ncbi:MAG: hypothetical protein ACLUE2_11750 [Bacteroides cellulosilyticus]